MNRIISKKGVPIKGSLFYFLFSILNSCIESPVYEKNIPISNYSWDYQQTPQFNMYVDNTDRSFDLFLNLRHTSKYKYSNLSLIIEEVNPSKEEKTYRLNLQLADSDGRWKGTGTGNILSHQVQFLKDYHFADTGIYTFKIKQNTHVNPLPEIVDIGIKVINGKVIASN